MAVLEHSRLRLAERLSWGPWFSAVLELSSHNKRIMNVKDMILWNQAILDAACNAPIDEMDFYLYWLESLWSSSDWEL
jgi:hypothetical protein